MTMRRLSLAFCTVLSLSAAAANAQVLPISQGPALSVGAGQAARIHLSAPARDIVVGDPTVADVNLIDERTLVVLGKKVGATTLLAFDARGRSLADRQIMVLDAPDGAVVVHRGASPSTYACADRCSRMGGDEEKAAAPAAASVP
jgi:Flp pilus assembly secretin CpaC